MLQRKNRSALNRYITLVQYMRMTSMKNALLLMLLNGVAKEFLIRMPVLKGMEKK